MYLSGFAAIAGLFDTSLFKQKHPQKLIPYQNGIHKKFKKDLSALKKKKKKIFFEGAEKKKVLELQAVRLGFLRNDSWYPTVRRLSPASRLHSSSFPAGE